MVLGALIFVALQTYAVSGSECKPPEEKIYHFSDTNDTLSWTEALAVCGQDGMTLATITNQLEYDEFMYELGVSGENISSYWVGATCEGGCKEGDRHAWYWITDNSRFDRTPPLAENWPAGFPTFKTGTYGDRLTSGSEGATVLSVYQNDHLFYNNKYSTKQRWVCQECRPKYGFRSLKKSP